MKWCLTLVLAEVGFALHSHPSTVEKDSHYLKVQAKAASQCFFDHVGETAAFDACTRTLCHQNCGLDTLNCNNPKVDVPFCKRQLAGFLQEFDNQYPNPFASALLQGNPAKPDPAAERAVAIAHDFSRHASACFVQHVGDDKAYKSCTRGICFRECGAHLEGCADLCAKQAMALLQKMHNPTVVKDDPQGARMANASNALVKSASACFLNHVGDSKAYERCSAALCHKECGLDTLNCNNPEVDVPLCKQQLMSFYQQKMQNPSAVRDDPQGARMAEASKVRVNSASACFLNHVGDSKAYERCTAALCHKECGLDTLNCNNPEVDVPFCKQQLMSFYQKSVSLQRSERTRAPEDDLAKEMTHDLEMNFNKIAPFGKEDTAKELQDHAAQTQNTLVDAVENAEVAEIKRAVFRALTRLRAATIKEFDTIARLETQAIDAYNDAHHYRAENPLAHLHEDEAPVETDKLKSFH